MCINSKQSGLITGNGYIMTLHKMLPTALPAAKPWRWEKQDYQPALKRVSLSKASLTGRMPLEDLSSMRALTSISRQLLLLASQVDITDKFSKQAAAEKQENRQYLLKALSSIRFLARQGLPLSGGGNDMDSNLHQLMVLQREDCPSIHQFLGRQQLKYTSHQVQNEMLSIMTQQVLHRIAEQIQSAVFSLLWLMKQPIVSTRAGSASDSGGRNGLSSI